MVFTAKCLYNEKLLSEAWRRWHLEFVRYKAIRKVEAFDKKQQMTMVFVSWKNLCKKHQTRKISLIPLPVSPAFNMPVAGTSSPTTPTEDYYDTHETNGNPTGRVQARPARGSRLPSLSARNSPTSAAENSKLSFPSNKRRGSIY
ncbi:hypothetical protein DPMN_161970 [Dreissena polymorpha]|uniref:Uncharacterized protein n=1 Tax=Dreissena polymorpha TaxID=45954 RepID=A0A9D4ETZ9_DREPO|nr:hypothetical protein DPMN_161970 [Dreissena polymorpha]